MGSHTGTHIDAPSHFIPGGKTIDQIPLSLLIGPALVINLTHKKRRNDYAALEVLARGVRVLGTDTLSPDETPYGGCGGESGFGGGIIAENLTNLEGLADGMRVYLLPLNLEGCDGSPVRAYASG
ncbi:hypothetical protein BD779DRAFT_1578461 [Infundibulicybe gibba]|nr:hypothetical protein BD779DRAFT_1578461 [Infundibulicybe gibba]